MGDGGQPEGLERARSLEQKQKLDEAVFAYIQANAPEEAARVLIQARRFKDAARLLLKTLRIPPRTPGDLAEAGYEEKQLAHKAALCLWKAGERLLGYQILLALEDFLRAEQLLIEIGDKVELARLRRQVAARNFVPEESVRNVGTAEFAASVGLAQGSPGGPGRAVPEASGAHAIAAPEGQGTHPASAVQPGYPGLGTVAGVVPLPPAEDSLEAAESMEARGDLGGAYQMYGRLRDYYNAARMLSAMGRPRDAAAILERQGYAFEAATAYYAAGDAPRALDALEQVAPTARVYRRACVYAVKLAVRTNDVDRAFLAFVRPFFEEAPADEQEADAMYVIAGELARRGRGEEAVGVYQRILQTQPRHRDVAERLQNLEQDLGLLALPPEAVCVIDQARPAPVPEEGAEDWLEELPSMSMEALPPDAAPGLQLDDPAEEPPPSEAAAVDAGWDTPGDETPASEGHAGNTQSTTVEVAIPVASGVDVVATPEVPPDAPTGGVSAASSPESEPPPSEVTRPLEVTDNLRPALSSGDAITAMADAKSRDDVGDILVDYLRSAFGAGLVLVPKDDLILGWKGFAPSVPTPVLEGIALPLSSPSVLKTAWDAKAPFRGPPPESGATLHGRLFKLLRCSSPPSEVLVVPLLVGKRVVNLLYGQPPEGGSLPETVAADAAGVAGAAAAAYARIIRKTPK